MLALSLIRIGVAGLLIWALADHPYAYYTLLRWIVCSTAAFGVYTAATPRRNGWIFLLGFAALLFNPFVPVHLTRQIWSVLNVGTSVIFLASIPCLRGAPQGGTA